MKRSRILRDRSHCRFLVTTKDNSAFAGVLWDHDQHSDGFIVLRDVTHHSGSDQILSTSVDGELVIAWREVAYMQRITPEDAR